MSVIFQVTSDHHILVYSLGETVILRSMTAGQWSKPSVLSNDYYAGLSATVFNASIHYSYINKFREIVVKSVANNGVLRSFPLLNDDYTFTPVLVSCNNALVLVYTSFDVTDSTYMLKCSFPLSTRMDINVSGKIKRPPLFKVMACDKQLYIYASDSTTSGIVMIDDSNIPTRLFTTNEADVIAVSKFHNAIAEKDSIIENIKSQYEALMDTATKYRDENLMLRSKYAPRTSNISPMATDVTDYEPVKFSSNSSTEAKVQQPQQDASI